MSDEIPHDEDLDTDTRLDSNWNTDNNSYIGKKDNISILLEFLSEKSIQNNRYVSGEICIDSLSLTKKEFVETVQILEDEGYVHVS